MGDGLPEDDWHKMGLGAKPTPPDYEKKIGQVKRPMTPAELKQAMENYWNNVPARSYHGPARFVDNANQGTQMLITEDNPGETGALVGIAQKRGANYKRYPHRRKRK